MGHFQFFFRDEVPKLASLAILVFLELAAITLIFLAQGPRNIHLFRGQWNQVELLPSGVLVQTTKTWVWGQEVVLTLQVTKLSDFQVTQQVFRFPKAWDAVIWENLGWAHIQWDRQRGEILIPLGDWQWRTYKARLIWQPQWGRFLLSP